MAARTGTEERYTTEMGELWSALALTLAHLDRLAADPESLDADESPDALRRLQYALHIAGERIYGLAPPADAEPAHDELWKALSGARDATGEIAEALEDDGTEAVEPLVHEWRGALFRVRLARMRLSPQSPAPAAPPDDPTRTSRPHRRAHARRRGRRRVQPRSDDGALATLGRGDARAVRFVARLPALALRRRRAAQASRPCRVAPGFRRARVKPSIR